MRPCFPLWGKSPVRTLGNRGNFNPSRSDTAISSCGEAALHFFIRAASSFFRTKKRSEKCFSDLFLHAETQAMMSRVSRAMTSSSLVGITKTLTLESGVLISISSPRFLLASSSIFTPR